MSLALLAARRAAETPDSSHPIAGGLGLAVIGCSYLLLALAARAILAGHEPPGGMAATLFVMFFGAPWGAGYAGWVWYCRPHGRTHRALAVVGGLLPIVAMVSLSIGLTAFVGGSALG